MGPIQLNVLLLDSAWLAEGGDLDTGRLLVGERQVIDAHSPLPAPALTFALCHHPFAWLREFEQVSVENLLLDRVSIVLRGHVHSADIRATEALEHRLTSFTAGATFESRTASNSYTYAAVDMLTGRGECIAHNYVHSEKRWEAAEARSWVLRAPNSVSLQQALELFNQSNGTSFAAYKASLLAGYTSDIPRQVSGTYLFLNVDITLPNDENPIGKTLLALRHLLTWRTAWNPSHWTVELNRHLADLDGELTDIARQASGLRDYLEGRERLCRNNIAALGAGITSGTSALVQNLIDLELQGEFSTVIQVIERARQGDVLTAAELRQLADLEVRAFLGLHDAVNALEWITTLLASEPCAERYYLAAQCQYELHCYAKAAAHMHDALDSGIPTDRAQRLSLLIAGQAGDSELSKRVLEP